LELTHLFHADGDHPMDVTVKAKILGSLAASES